jgi:hypothetical protein
MTPNRKILKKANHGRRPANPKRQRLKKVRTPR